jgi:hypothetical protein
MLLREEIRSFSVSKMLTVPVYSSDIKRYIQLRTPDALTAVSKDKKGILMG